jgi:hypothetical protein
MSCESCCAGDGAFLVSFAAWAAMRGPVFIVCGRCLGVPDDRRMQMIVLDLERSGLEAAGAQQRRPR